MITRRKSMQLLGACTLGLAGAGSAQGDPAMSPPTGPHATDAVFNQPYIDVDEWRDSPVRHRYVHGGFKGTDARFVFCFPPKDRYQGRFFHYVTPVPAPEGEVLHGFGGESLVPFCLESGAYAVGTNQGGAAATATPTGQVDPTIGAYRVNAAAANYSRQLAAEMYGPHRTFGYAFGGSGGSFRTIGGFENTDAWDGVVPFVMGTPMHIPSVLTVRAHATRLLKGKVSQVVDAIEPGGSGDMYAALDDEQRAALREATRMGLPPKAWWLAQEGKMDLGSLPILLGAIKAEDPGYFHDFWTVPGYLGAKPPKSLLDDRVQHATTVLRLVMSDQAAAAGLPAPGGGPQVDADTAWRNLERHMGGSVPVALELRDPPRSGDLRLGSILVKSGAAAGRSLLLSGLRGAYAMLGASPLSPTQPAAPIRPGDEVVVDNSDFLAVQTYHRHQVPTPDYCGWDQFRRADGSPIYPQRPRLIGPDFYKAAAGAPPSAKFAGKMIVVECLMDYDAFPWGADWYRRKVSQNLGPAYEDQYRLWFVERAVHGDPPWPNPYIVPYTPVLQQALRDLSAWVEMGAPAPATTSYDVVDSQIVVPALAAQRKGVQPVVTLSADGAASVHARTGQSISFEGRAQTPPHTGKIVAAEWDFEGRGTFPAPAQITPAEQIVVKAEHAFDHPGVYFATLRVASQRQGDPDTPFARIPNLARVRVVVT